MTERWKPEIGQAYWVVDLCYSKKVKPSSWANDHIDNNCYSCNNCFKTEAEAQAAAEKVKALLLSLQDNGETLQAGIQDKQLPDWCKVGEWVYLSNAKYYKIKKVDSYRIILDCGIVIKTDDIHAEAVSARLRPYNVDEMRGLVGKVIELEDYAFLIIAYSAVTQTVSFNNYKYTASDLLNDNITIDGNPCGKLEHLENGEWVE